MKKGWRTPFSFKIIPRRARRTGPQALFVGSLAEKRCFFAKLAGDVEGMTDWSYERFARLVVERADETEPIDSRDGFG